MTLPMSLDANAAAAVLAWYDRHRRELPWRVRPGEAVDPYKVWLSEIMLQQTTVTAVKPYFAAFLSLWPNVGLLAEARSEEVMRAWAGLGYYSRARNLHACAKIIAERFNGVFPPTEAALRELPGIGPYTAAAIAAIAFGQRAVRHRWQCHAGCRAAFCDRHAASSSVARDQGKNDSSGPGCAARRFRASDDGPWRDGVHAAIPVLRTLPVARLMPWRRIRHCRKPSTQGTAPTASSAPGRHFFCSPPRWGGSGPDAACQGAARRHGGIARNRLGRGFRCELGGQTVTDQSFTPEARSRHRSRLHPFRLAARNLCRRSPKR